MEDKKNINIIDKILELRDILDSSICYKQEAWNKKNKGKWNQLWSACDGIEDTQSAINEFQLNNNNLLEKFGLLQALVVQQDAVRHLEEALRIKTWSSKDYPELQEIREVRIETIGHPTKTDKKGTYEDGKTTYTSLSQRKTNSNILMYGVWSKSGFEHKEINLKNIIESQEKLTIIEIDKIIKKICTTESNHMNKFKDKKLEDIFKPTSYLIQKLWPFEKDRIHSDYCFNSLKEIYNNFKNEIKKRYKLERTDEFGIQIPGLILEIQKIDKLIPRIEKMILKEPGIDELDLEVYIESLDNSFENLRGMAKEIDIKFNKNQ